MLLQCHNHEGGGGLRSGSFNISKRGDKREQVSTILVNISVNEAVVFTSMVQLLAVLALLGRILDAHWSRKYILIGCNFVSTMERYRKALREVCPAESCGPCSVPRALLRPAGPCSVPRGPAPSRGALLRPAGPYSVPRGLDSFFGALIR